MAVNKVNIGNAGEHLAAAQLQLRGYTVAMPPAKANDIDLLAINTETHKQIAIQVKTESKSSKRWLLGEKNEKLVGDNIFYIFVSLNDGDHPTFHIVPSKVVAHDIAKYHQEWLAKPGKNGQPHNPVSMRTFSDQEDKYLDRWDLID